jgi:predicted DNA-binding ribbon-helix-helix protein
VKTNEEHLISRNVTIGARRTSLRLEREIWEALEDICQREKVSLNEMCCTIDQYRHNSNRTSAIRAFIVTYFRALATSVENGSSPMELTGRVRSGTCVDSASPPKTGGAATRARA